MKYIIEKSDLFIDNKLYSEGTEIELSEAQTKGLEDYLIPISNGNDSKITESHPELVEGQKKLNTKGNKK